MNLSQITTEKCIWKRKSDFKKSLRSENWDDRNCKKKIMISCGHLSDFFKIGFSLSYTFFSRNLWFPCGKFIDYYVLMHVSFKIHHRNNLIDKKDSYLIPRPPSWDDRNYSYSHQFYPSGLVYFKKSFPLKLLGQMNRNWLGRIYGRSSIKIAHFVPIY
jgi:hypothetical protein